MQELSEAIHIAGKSTWLWDASFSPSVFLSDVKAAIGMDPADPLLGSPMISFPTECQDPKIITCDARRA